MAGQREEISAQFAQIRSVLELGMGENEGALMGRLDPRARSLAEADRSPHAVGGGSRGAVSVDFANNAKCVRICASSVGVARAASAIYISV